MLALDRRDAWTAQVRQQGWLDGQPLSLAPATTCRPARAHERRFLLRLAGELAGSPTQLLRVSNSWYLWTDLMWLDDPAAPERRVSRIDLRHVRRAIAELGPTNPLAIDPNSWSRYGGLPHAASRPGARVRVRASHAACNCGKRRC